MTNSTLQPGQLFGQYRILRQLGRGGMGEVYAVEHEVLREKFALKLLNEDLINSQEAVDRLKREAQVMAKLRHPNIVHVDDFGETDGRYWLRMELVRNHGGHGDTEENSFDVGSTDGAASLADYLKERGGKLPESEVREILRQILEGLAYAHSKGVVHRDLKPANILLASKRGLSGEARRAKREDTEESSLSPLREPRASVRNPLAKIADFGLVRLVGEEWLRSQVERSVARSIHSTGSGQVSIGAERTMAADSLDGTGTRALLGTYAYMSPEQKRGEEADERSDLYAVGLMVYQMLTGEETPGFDLPSDLVKGLDPVWDDWVRNATRPKAEMRYSSALEMQEQLPSIRARHPGNVERSQAHPKVVPTKHHGFDDPSLTFTGKSIPDGLRPFRDGQEKSKSVPKSKSGSPLTDIKPISYGSNETTISRTTKHPASPSVTPSHKQHSKQSEPHPYQEPKKRKLHWFPKLLLIYILIFILSNSFIAYKHLKEKSQRETITNNLRQIVSGGRQFMLEEGTVSANYNDLAGTYFPELQPVAGEDYSALTVTSNGTLSVETDFGEVSYEY